MNSGGSHSWLFIRFVSMCKLRKTTLKFRWEWDSLNFSLISKKIRDISNNADISNPELMKENFLKEFSTRSILVLINWNSTRNVSQQWVLFEVDSDHGIYGWRETLPPCNWLDSLSKFVKQSSPSEISVENKFANDFHEHRKSIFSWNKGRFFFW